MESRIYDLYANYLRAVDDYYSSQSTGSLLIAMLAGRGRHSGCPLHEPFLERLQQDIKVFVETDPSSVAAERVLTFMLFTDHVPPKHPACLLLETAEGLALPIIPFLSEARRQDFFAQYRRKLRKNPGLPCQRIVLEKLKPLRQQHA